MTENMQHWTPRPRPGVEPMEGRFVRLEKLDPADRFRWLPDLPPTDKTVFRRWVEESARSEDPLFFAVIDKASGKVAGRQTFLRIDAPNGVAEIGHIYWGPLISRKAAATEALYLFTHHVFDELGYRRFEWKCNNDNLPSKRAAERFSFQFEGVFRQHLVVKGLNRDTAWFAMIDKDWPMLKPAYEAWLAPENFNDDGQQKRKLEDFRRDFGAKLSATT